MNPGEAAFFVVVMAMICSGIGFVFGILVDVLKDKDVEAVMWGAGLAVFLPAATFIITYATLR